jgi:hypothetical protein
MSASRHAADVHAGVDPLSLHTDAIAQDGASGEGAAGVDRNDGQHVSTLPVCLGKPVHQCALSGAGTAGDTQDLRFAAVGE